MIIRNKEAKELLQTGKFNIHSLDEILVYGPDWMDSDYMEIYDVHIKKSEQWKDLRQAFMDKDIITDNYNTCFFEPANEEDRERGFTL